MIAALENLRFLAEFPFELSLTDGEHIKLLARLLAGVEFLGRRSSRWYESRVFPWGFFRRGPALRKQTLRLAAQLRLTLFGRTSPDQQKLIDEQLAKFAGIQRELRRHDHLGSKQAARGALLGGLSRNKIRTDIGAAFPRVLSHDQWQAVRRTEDVREQARLTLEHEKATARTSYLLAMGGRPLPDADARLQAALQPFVEACQSLRSTTAGQAVTQPTSAEVAVPAAIVPEGDAPAVERAPQSQRVSA
jgi:hypothetical protein